MFWRQSDVYWVVVFVYHSSSHLYKQIFFVNHLQQCLLSPSISGLQYLLNTFGDYVAQWFPTGEELTLVVNLFIVNVALFFKLTSALSRRFVCHLMDYHTFFDQF